jgi:hypothetical protein
MQLSARFLYGYANVNSWQEVRQVANLTASQAQDLYIQLVDLTADVNAILPGRRFCPSASAVLTVTIPDMDDSKVITRVCSQASPLDTSIFRLQLLDSDAIPMGTKSLNLVLVDGGVTKKGFVHQGLRISGFEPTC